MVMQTITVFYYINYDSSPTLMHEKNIWLKIGIKQTKAPMHFATSPGIRSWGVRNIGFVVPI